jgi:transposase
MELKISTRDINKTLSTGMDVLRSSARKSRMERINNEHIKEIMGVKEKQDITDIIENKRLQWYSYVKRMPEEGILKLIMEWIPQERTMGTGSFSGIKRPGRGADPFQCRGRE